MCTGYNEPCSTENKPTCAHTPLAFIAVLQHTLLLLYTKQPVDPTTHNCNVPPACLNVHRCMLSFTSNPCTPRYTTMLRLLLPLLHSRQLHYSVILFLLLLLLLLLPSTIVR
jgi:hypothetical protein